MWEPDFMQLRKELSYYFWAPPIVKETVKIREKNDLKVWYPENLISRIAKMMKIWENKILRIAISNFKHLANLAKICEIAQFNSRENLFP